MDLTRAGFNPNATCGDLVDVGPENLLVQGM
uniref:Uncharacterized protein n=1 Tax=Tetranychus urticae TaxID=32264 RepID=T1K483_TETUR